MKAKRAHKESAPTCEFPPAGGKQSRHKGSPLRARLHRYDGRGGWSGVHSEAYKAAPDGSWQDVVRRSIIGGRGEQADFHLRYFELAPGGSTSLERHEHEHVVIAIRGKGTCRIRRTSHEMGYLDIAYIPPGAVHQLINTGTKEPFGFFCIVDAERDRPVLVGGKGGK